MDDRQCAGCHSEIAVSFAAVGMARSFFRPDPSRALEDFGAGSRFTHAASGLTYEMAWTGDGLLFRQEPVSGGEPLEQRVDWILGSGEHARTYVFRTPGGELYQLPVAWYTQEQRWGMAPGYDRADHQGLGRAVRRECLFCHNAYPSSSQGPFDDDAQLGSDDGYGDAHLFPERLPEGIGCQRCHGAGARHVAAARGGEPIVAVRGAIVNPSRLPADRREDLCYACHLQASVALFAVRRFDRTDYSWRPGERLADYRVELDVEDAGRASADRFEINHHGHRLRQSRCFLESESPPSCLTCHDPHRKVPPAERAAHYRRACVTCHPPASLRAVPEHAPQDGASAADCVACHMPRRRTQDVVHVVMTDHKITRHPGGAELVAPLSERDPVLTGVLLAGEGQPAGPLGEVYRAVGALRLGEGARAVDHLELHLAAAAPQQAEPWIELAVGQMRQRRFAAAEQTLRSVLERWPQDAAARERLPLALSGLGRVEEALAASEAATVARPERAENWFNLGLLRSAAGRSEAASDALEHALRLRPNFVEGWIQLARLQARLGRLEDARRSLAQALALDPSSGEAKEALRSLPVEPAVD